MKSTSAILCAGALLSLSAVAASPPPAAPGPNQQTKILRITREYVKPGQLSAVVEIDRQKAKAFRDAKWDRASLAFKTLTGPDQIVFLSFYDELAPIQSELQKIDHSPALSAKVDKAARDAGNLMTFREDFVTRFRPEITYRPVWNWAKTRCIDMLKIKLQGGKAGEYVENRLLTLDSHERGGQDTHVFMYSVMSGTPSWTFYIIRPMPDIAHLDMLHSGEGEPMNAWEKRHQVQLFGEAAASEEEVYLCADPSISVVPAAWAGDDNSFWNAK